jgi:hypothetical protein
MLAAVAFTAPLGAEEINTPDAHRQEATTQPSAPSSAHDEGYAENAAENAAQDAAQTLAQNVAPGGPHEAAPAPEATPVQAAAVSIQVPKPDAQDETQKEKAEAQLKKEEKQRVLGVVPSFNVVYDPNAVSLTKMQKMRLAFHSSTDPVAFGAAFLTAGYHEALNDVSGFPWGAKGYAERSGAAYLDSFDGTMIGNGILPALLHQDPRYFRLGHGSVTHRLFYAAATAVICKHDNTGKWEPNYSNMLGNIASGGISNLYYPGNSGIGLTISNGMIQTAEGAIGAVFQEFWPDIHNKLFKTRKIAQ